MKISKRAAFATAAVAAAAFAVPALATPHSPQGGQSSVGCNDGTVTWSPTNLWPPNHKLVPISISYRDSDGDGDTTAITVTGVTEQDGANAPVNARVPQTLKGSGKPGQIDSQPDANHPDTAGSDGGADATATEDVRAERSGTDGHGSGRTYTITVQCMDSGGSEPPATNSADLTVTVPHDQGVVKP